jgi:hypothetical protein
MKVQLDKLRRLKMITDKKADQLLDLSANDESISLDKLMNGNYKSLKKLLLMDKRSIKKINPEMLKAYELCFRLCVRYYELILDYNKLSDLYKVKILIG